MWEEQVRLTDLREEFINMGMRRRAFVTTSPPIPIPSQTQAHTSSMLQTLLLRLRCASPVFLLPQAKR